MAFVIADRVRETTTTTGTGAVTLAGAYISFQSFSTAIGNGNNTYYTIASPTTGEWEVGIGTYTSSTNSLSRDTVLSSSNSGSLVSFTAGSKDVFVTQPASRAIFVQNGGAGLQTGNAAFTANQVLYSNATTTTATSANLTFDGTTLTANAETVNNAVTHSATTANLAYGTSQTSGTWTAGGAAQTGTITLDQSTKTHTLSIGSGATENLLTKTINLGTGGVSGSTTTMTIGSTNGTTVAANGTWTFSGTPTFSGGTANGVLYLNGSKVATSGSALTFDGTTLENTGKLLLRTSSAPSLAGQYGYDTSVGTYIWAKAGSGSNFTLYNNAGYNAYTIDASDNHIWARGTGSELMRLTSTGLGIGTSSPSYKLSVNTGVAGVLANFTDGVAQTIRLTTGSGFAAIDNPSAGALAFQIAGTERMRLDSSGNLGIGTSSPSSRLDIAGSATAGMTLLQQIRTGSGNSYGFQIKGNYTTEDYIIQNYYSAALAFGTNNTERMRLDSSGNLGLGVTPSASNLATIQSDYGIIVGNTGINIAQNAYYNSGWKYISSAVATRYAQSGGIHYWYNAASGTAGTAITWTQAMTLDASGRLGIGVTAPLVGLDVRGTSNTAASTIQVVGNTISSLLLGQNADGGVIRGQGGNNALTFWTGGSGDTGAGLSGTERARIDSSGRVCIGGTTVTDGHLLNIQGSTASNNIGIVLNKTNATAQIWGITNTGPLAFYNYTASSEAMRIDTSGNLGIGTSSPNSLLTVQNGNILLRSAVTTGALSSYNLGFSATATGGAAAYITSYRENANEASALVFGTWNGSASGERARIDSSGRLLVGTATASGTNRLLVDAANSGSEVIRAQNTGGTGARIASWADGSATLGSGPNFYMQNVTGPNTWAASMQMGASAEIIFFQYPNSSWSERARIDSSGNWLVGATSSAANSGTGVKLLPSGYVYVVAPSTTSDTYNYYNSTAGAYRFYVTNAGVINATSTTITAISDQRLKENIQDIDVGLDAVMALKPRKFDWKAGKGKDKKGDRGWIAQEFEQVFPDMITTWKDEPPEGEEPYKAVNADLIPVLVKAIQEQQAIIEQLKADVAALKGA